MQPAVGIDGDTHLLEREQAGVVGEAVSAANRPSGDAPEFDGVTRAGQAGL